MGIEWGVLVLGAAVLGAVRLVRRVSVPAGSAVLVYGVGAQPRIHLSGSFWARAGLDRCETVALPPVVLTVDRRGKEGVPCRDCIRVDLTLRFHLEVVRTAESVLQLVQLLGVARVADPRSIQMLFELRFLEAVTASLSRFDYDQLLYDPEAWKRCLLSAIGTDLNGYRLERVDIGHLEHTPVAFLDPRNSTDAVGIRLLTERAAAEQLG